MTSVYWLEFIDWRALMPSNQDILPECVNY